MTDVNHFKDINDRLGHLAGDRVLVDLAGLLKKTFRGSDSIIRFGGDEFVVVMPDTSEAEGEKAVARLLSSVERWHGIQQGPAITISCA